jgi:hypothetical protein
MTDGFAIVSKRFGRQVRFRLRSSGGERLDPTAVLRSDGSEALR